MNVRTMLIGIVLGIALCAFTLDISNPVAVAKSCSDIMLLYARGSGQSPHPDFGGELLHDEISRFFSEFENRFELAPDVSIENRELLYPAKPNLEDNGPWGFVGAEFKIREDGFNTYDQSKRAGTDLAVEEISEAVAECPDQRIVLGGYSQGAHVMGNSLHRLPTDVLDNVSFVALFGDPRFNPRSVAAKGTFRTGKIEVTVKTPGKDIIFNQAGGVLERRAEFPSLLTEKGRVGSWCVQYDGICENDYSRVKGPRSKHGTYPDHAIPSAMSSAAVKVMRDLQVINPDEPLTYNFGSENSDHPMDVVFVVEYNKATRTLKNGKDVHAQRWIDELSSRYNNLRLGITHYFDIGGCACSETDSRLNDGHHYAQRKLELTTDFDAFKTTLDTWNVSSKSASAKGGGTRGMYSGMTHALRHQPWREGAQKKIIVIAASPPADPEKISRLAVPSGGNEVDVAITAQHVKAKAHAVDPVNVYGVGLNPDKDFSAIESLSAATEGEFYNYSDGADLVSSLVSELNQRPVAVTPLLYEGVVGESITLSAASSYDPDGDQIVEYAWDFDDDGTFDQTTSSPVTTHVYAAPYHGFASVRVLSEDGTTNTATPTMYITEESDAEIVNPTPGFTATAVTSSQTELQWDYSSSDDVYFLLFVDGEYFGGLNGTKRSFTIQGIDNSEQHEYALIAVRESELSEASFAITEALTSGFSSDSGSNPAGQTGELLAAAETLPYEDLGIGNSSNYFSAETNPDARGAIDVLGDGANNPSTIGLVVAIFTIATGLPVLIWKINTA